MRDCSKCGSYVPEGKLLCPVCGRVGIGVSKNVRESTLREQQQTKRRFEIAERDSNPYAGGTYEQHKSHEYDSEEYYELKDIPSAKEQDMTKRIFCAAAYFGFFFFLPLIALPDSKEAKFHANQGLVLFLFGTLLGGIAAASEMVLGGVFTVLNVMYPLLMVYGAANAFRGNMTELPLIGKLRILKGYDKF